MKGEGDKYRSKNGKEVVRMSKIVTKIILLIT